MDNLTPAQAEAQIRALKQKVADLEAEKSSLQLEIARLRQVEPHVEPLADSEWRILEVLCQQGTLPVPKLRMHADRGGTFNGSLESLMHRRYVYMSRGGNHREYSITREGRQAYNERSGDPR
jgi:hypothetical protein